MLVGVRRNSNNISSIGSIDSSSSDRGRAEEEKRKSRGRADEEQRKSRGRAEEE